MRLFLVSLHLQYRAVCTYLFIQEVEISGTLVLDILSLVRLVVPVSFLFPLLVFLFLELGGVIECVFLLSFLAVYLGVSHR